MYIQPDIFRKSEGIVAGFSTRAGGVSLPPYESLNLGLSTKDEEKHVLANRRRLFEAVGFSVENLAITGQVHGTDLIEVDTPGLYVGYDAMVTRQRGVLLCLSAADCASVLMADAENQIVGACHAGWRGAAGGIVGKTLKALLERGAELDALKAYVSPCISMQNFEVGDEVACQFDSKFVYKIEGKEKPRVDIKEAILSQLVDAGVSLDAIEVSPHCTYADRSQFFSYRAEKGVTGRHMGFIGMK